MSNFNDYNDHSGNTILSPSDVRRMFSVPSLEGPSGYSIGDTTNQRILPPTAGEACAKCGERVYPVEKIGPVNKVVFHKGCFKCSECGQNLSLKTYFTNPVDQSDKHLYCGKHCPKITSQGVDASAMGIRAALNAPTPGLQSSVNEVVRWYGDIPKIDLKARHIRDAIWAQNEFDRKYLLDNKHHFPVWVGETRRKLLQYQEELERMQREEEDRLVKDFHDERIKEAELMDLEIKQEWEINLQKLMNEYDSKNKKSSGYDKEIHELNKTMKIKRASKVQALTLKLQDKAQAKTAEMVKKHSEEMLTLIHSKQQEMKKEIEMEIISSVGDNPQALAEALTAITISKDIPDAHPPGIRKRDLYHDPSVFSGLDEEVFKVAESEQCSFTELVNELTANCMSDLQKARAIFRWITVKDLNVMEFSETVKQETPLGLLRGIKYGTETYHSLFMRLCSYAGLVCKEVKGHSKSVGYEPGMKIHADAFLNTWNVILIAGDWWPVQCNWAARHLVMNREPEPEAKQAQMGSKRSRDKIRYEYDEHYFLTDPDEFVMEFWAKDPKWQLLEAPITLGEFEFMPFVRSIFFHNGLEFADDSKRAILETNSHGGVELKLDIPKELKKELIFHYHFRIADRERRRETQYNGINLERYVFHTVNDDTAFFSVHVPSPGSYFFEVFVNQIDENIKYHEDSEFQGNLFQSFRLKCATKVRVVCKAISGKMFPLPSCASGEWGPIKAKRYFGIVCLSHQVGVINAEEEATIRLQLKKRMLVRAEMHFNGVNKRDLNKFLNLTVGDDLVATLKVVFPRKGQFGVDIYAKVDDSNDSTDLLTHICKFLINCTQVNRPVDLPMASSESLRREKTLNESLPRQGRSMENENTLPAALPSHVERLQTRTIPETPNNSPLYAVVSRTLPSKPQDTTNFMSDTNNLTPGPTPAFQLYGIKCLSHKTPEIVDFDKQGGVVVEMSCATQDFKLIPKLIRDLHQENLTHCVNVRESSKKFKFQVTLPKHGKFWLVITAVNKNHPQSRLSDVYTYVLTYVDNASVRGKTSMLKK